MPPVLLSMLNPSQMFVQGMPGSRVSACIVAIAVLMGCLRAIAEP